MSSVKQHAQLTTKSVETTGERPANVRSGEKWMRVISTARVADRDDEIIDTGSLHIPTKPTGWKYAKDLAPSDVIDMGFFYDHQMAAEKQLGSVRSMFVNGDGELETVVAFTSLQRGQDAYTLAQEGHLGNSLSGTFSYRTAHQDEAGVFYDMEMVELSLVFKGANQNARVLEVSKRFKGESMAEAKTLDEKKAELDALQKEVSELEAQVQPEPPVEEEAPVPAEEQTEIVEDQAEVPVQEDEPQEDETAPVVAEPAEVETQPPESKSVKQETPTMSDVIAKQVKDTPTPEVLDTPVVEKMDKYDLVAKQFTAWVNKDAKTLAELNQKALDTFTDAKSKATYMNTGVIADGGAIVPSNELLTDVFTTLTNYSTVANDLRVITLTEGNGIDVATLVTDVIVSEVTTEGGNKPVTKPVLGDGEVNLREFAGIAILTKKLVRQAAINVYDLIRESFARAIANQRAVMALTDATSGIANKAGVVTVYTGTGNTTVDKVTWANIRKMPYQLPVAAVPGSKYYISRELLEVLDGMTVSTTDARPLDIVELDGDGLSGRFRNGFRFAVEEVLGKSGAPHAIFGNMGRYGILLRQGAVESETFDTGSVTDGSSVVHNLLQQNKLAHRVAFYENVGYPLPGAFVKLVLGTA